MLIFTTEELKYFVWEADNARLGDRDHYAHAAMEFLVRGLQTQSDSVGALLIATSGLAETWDLCYLPCFANFTNIKRLVEVDQHVMTAGPSFHLTLPPKVTSPE